MSAPRVVLHPGDNRDSLRRLIDQGVRVHSVVTDPPYGLTSITKRFGKQGSAAAKSNGATGVFKRASGGFMGQQWDGSGIERDPEFWKLIYDILLPGGYVLAFSSPRTGHWQACAMEMAGFIMHPFFGWVYGSGFPKDHDAAMAIDKALGVSGSRGGVKPGFEGHYGKDNLRSLRESGTMAQENGFSRPWMNDPDALLAYQSRYLPGSPEAAQWDGWAYGVQSLKPALEPVYFAQKPFSEKNGALNLLKHGVGAVNIDGCRVGIDPVADASQLRTMNRNQRTDDKNGQQWGMSKSGSDKPSVVRAEGRHPANLIHDNSDEVRAMFPDSGGQRGVLKGHKNDRQSPNGTFGKFGPANDCEPRGDSGSAARFFNSFPFEAEPLFYHAKATKADRAGSKHPTVKPVALMQHYVRLVTPPGGVVLDPFGGSGTTAEAARREGFDCILMEADEQYISDIFRRFGLDDGRDLL